MQHLLVQKRDTARTMRASQRLLNYEVLIHLPLAQPDY